MNEPIPPRDGLFIVSRASFPDDEECPVDGAFKGLIVCEGSPFQDDWEWLIELSDLESLLQFVKDQGTIVLSTWMGYPEIQIYDASIE